MGEYNRTIPWMAERAVKTFKVGMKKAGNTGSVERRMVRLLFQYRIAPYTMKGVSPAALLFGRHIRSHLQQLLLDLSTKVESKQATQKCNHDNHTNLRIFKIGDTVFVRNFTNRPTWISGNTKEKRGQLSYDAPLSDGRIVKKHVDQIRNRSECT